MVKSRLDGPPELTEIERTIAHGKLLLKALYADHPGQRLAARRPSRCYWHSGWRLRRCLAARGPPSCPKPGPRWVLDARHVGRITRRDDGLYQVRIDAALARAAARAALRACFRPLVGSCCCLPADELIRVLTATLLSWSVAVSAPASLHRPRSVP